jgi:hypothetical protein
MLQRKIALSKQKHEVAKYLRRTKSELYNFAGDVGAIVQPLTVAITADGMGIICVPSQAIAERICPDNPPVGVLFADGSFFVFIEMVRFGYPDERATEPRIYRVRYSYHYQRNDDHFYFRFDHHPDIGDPQTHPRFHLHSAGWRTGAAGLQETPRYRVAETHLPEVLALMLVSFPSLRSSGSCTPG